MHLTILGEIVTHIPAESAVRVLTADRHIWGPHFAFLGFLKFQLALNKGRL